MKEIIEIITELDFNNAILLFACGIAIIFVFAGYIEPLNASNIEIMLMNKTDVIKSNSFPVIMLFCIFTALNYVYMLSGTFLFVSILMLVLSLIGYMGIGLLNKFGKCKTTFHKVKGTLWLAAIISFFPLMTYAIIIDNNINKISCTLICSLIKTIIIFLVEFNFKPNDSKIILKVENKEWFVLRRMDDSVLCGNAKNSTDSTEHMIIKLETVIEKGLCFTKAQ